MVMFVEAATRAAKTRDGGGNGANKFSKNSFCRWYLIEDPIVDGCHLRPEEVKFLFASKSRVLGDIPT